MVFVDGITATGILSFPVVDVAYWLASRTRVALLRHSTNGRAFCYVFTMPSLEAVCSQSLCPKLISFRELLHLPTHPPPCCPCF